jgi:hypothetical protein
MQGERDGEVVALHDLPLDAAVIELVEDGAVPEPVAVDRDRGDDVRGARAVVQPA